MLLCLPSCLLYGCIPCSLPATEMTPQRWLLWSKVHFCSLLVEKVQCISQSLELFSLGSWHSKACHADKDLGQLPDLVPPRHPSGVWCNIISNSSGNLIIIVIWQSSLVYVHVYDHASVSSSWYSSSWSSLSISSPGAPTPTVSSCSEVDGTAHPSHPALHHFLLGWMKLSSLPASR